MEDFNNLLLHEQVELIRAQTAHNDDERNLHQHSACVFGKLIEEHAYPYRSRDKEGHVRFDRHACDELLVTPVAC